MISPVFIKFEFLYFADHLTWLMSVAVLINRINITSRAFIDILCCVRYTTGGITSDECRGDVEIEKKIYNRYCVLCHTRRTRGPNGAFIYMNIFLFREKCNYSNCCVSRRTRGHERDKYDYDKKKLFLIFKKLVWKKFKRSINRV